MKNYSKYICLFLIMIIGASTHVWSTTTVTLNSFGSDTENSYRNGGSFIDDASYIWTANGYLISSSKLVIGKGGDNYLQTPNFEGNEIKSITVTWYGNTDYYLALQTTDGTELEAIQNPSNASANPATRTFTVSGSYSQLRLVARRASGTDNARSTISSVVLVYGPPCANNVTITKGTATNCTFDLSVSGAQASCDGVETTITITPSTGYGTPVVSESGASVAPAPGGSGNTQTLTYSTNTTGTSVINVSCTANNYVVLLEDGAGSGGTGAVEVTYNANTNLTTSVEVPTRLGYAFAGYWTSSDAGSTLITQLIDNNGAWIASVTGYTDGSKNWKYADDLTLYAKWTPNNYKLTVGTPSNVTIKATPEDKSDITEGNYDAAVPCDAIVTLNAVAVAGYSQAGWKITKDADGSDVTTSYLYDETTMFMPPFDATVTATMYGDFVFSCSELTLTPHLVTAGTPIFITSAAGKTVRSQDYIEITGSGLTPSTALTFPGLPSKFAIKKADGTAVATDASGVVSTNAYIFYTPAVGDTVDGLDKLTGITVSVEGAKPKTASLTQSIIGRHLPAKFVIAAKKDGKWWALPSNMTSTTNPKPSEIAVNDYDNPSIAYTATSNIYGLEGPTKSGGAGNNIATGNGQYIRLTMSIEDGSGTAGPAPLFGSITGSNTIGKSGIAKATSDLSAGWWWQLKQTNTSITNPQNARYTIYCANNTSSLSLRDNAGNPDWGLFASGVEELRLIPASDIVFTEAYFVEWGQHGGVIEVDAQGIDATSVTAHLGANSATTTLNQTQTSVKNRASIYNYTVNFGGSIDFAAAASNGALLRLEWKNGEDVKAMTSLVVPKIIASNATMSSLMSGDTQWETEVHVLPGVTLTANAGDFSSNDVLINHLEIYPGATVVVTEGAAGSGTLKVKTLVLRNGWTRAGAKAYDVARLYITPTTASMAKNAVGDVWYADWYIDYDQYYPVAVPWDVTVENFTYRYCTVSPTVGPSANIRLRYYDGEQRASSGQGMIGQNWKFYGADGAAGVPTKLKPSKGYAMTAKRPTGKAFSIIRMPLTIPNASWTTAGEQGDVGGTHKDTVSVTAWGVAEATSPWYSLGWNFIGNPYMCTFNGDDDGITGNLRIQDGGRVKYATIPDIDFQNYDQVNIEDAHLKPASGFFVQVGTTGTLTFSNTKILPPSAPARYTTTSETTPEQEAYIRLSYEGGKDQMGLIIGEDYTEAYELNADLAKILGEGSFVKTYMQYGGMDMAYVAINQILAKEWIPVTVQLPVSGEYTYSLAASSEVAHLEGIYLIDYAADGRVTNLIEQDYTFVAEAGIIDGRFAINAIVGERSTPTDIDVVNGGGDLNSDKPFKFIYHDKVYIYHRGIIYNATGKRVREINK